MIPQLPNRPTSAAVDLDALAFNLHSIRAFIGSDVPCMAVVKANAYGHGAAECAKRLEFEGVEWFAVATIEEGVELRDSGIRKPILILGGLWPGQESYALTFDLTPVVFRIDQAESLNNVASAEGRIARMHVKIDSGMGRIGFRPEDVAPIAQDLSRLSNIEIEGVMTHFAVADKLEESDFTTGQITKFSEAVEVFRSFGIRPKYVDMANSPGAIAYPASRSNLVRLGGILYGLGDDVLPANTEKPELRPVMSLRSKIALIKKVRQGESVGYGRAFTARRDSLIATIPIGYHDGYSRSLSNKGQVIINGEFAPVVGRVSMDWTTLDITDIHNLSIGDVVTIIGTEGDKTIKAEDIARATETISYEVTCGIGARVPRNYT